MNFSVGKIENCFDVKCLFLMFVLYHLPNINDLCQIIVQSNNSVSSVLLRSLCILLDFCICKCISLKLSNLPGSVYKRIRSEAASGLGSFPRWVVYTPLKSVGRLTVPREFHLHFKSLPQQHLESLILWLVPKPFFKTFQPTFAH